MKDTYEMKNSAGCEVHNKCGCQSVVSSYLQVNGASCKLLIINMADNVGKPGTIIGLQHNPLTIKEDKLSATDHVSPLQNPDYWHQIARISATF